MNSKIIFTLILIGLLTVPMVFAQAPQKTIGDYLSDMFNWSAGAFADMESKGLESANFQLFFRIVLIILVSVLFYTLLHRYVFKESKDKNRNIVLAICLSLITTIAIPKKALIGLAGLYSGLLLFVLYGSVLALGGWLLFHKITGDSRGANFMKALFSAGLAAFASFFLGSFGELNIKTPGLYGQLELIWVICFVVFGIMTVVYLGKAFMRPSGTASSPTSSGGATPPAGGAPITPVQTPTPIAPVRPNVIPDISMAQKKLQELRADATAAQGATDFNTLIQTLRDVELKADELRNELILVENQRAMPQFSQTDSELGTMIAGARELTVIAQREQTKPKPPTFKQFRVQITRGRTLGGGSVGNAIEDLNSRCIALNAQLVKMLNDTQR